MRSKWRFISLTLHQASIIQSRMLNVNVIFKALLNFLFHILRLDKIGVDNAVIDLQDFEREQLTLLTVLNGFL
jgi:hypothetical protein